MSTFLIYSIHSHKFIIFESGLKKTMYTNNYVVFIRNVCIVVLLKKSNFLLIFNISIKNVIVIYIF